MDANVFDKSLNELDRRTFLLQIGGCYIPGYTGHCPTLKFGYGKSYGARTREILKELKASRFYHSAKLGCYGNEEVREILLKPLKEMQHDKNVCMDFRCKAPRFITGYTGFVPNLNFQYGESYSKLSENCMDEFENEKWIIKNKRDELAHRKNEMKLSVLKPDCEVKHDLDKYFKPRPLNNKLINAEYPPISGYTGHIPRVKGTEQALAQRYGPIVKAGLTALNKERKRMNELGNVQQNLNEVLANNNFDY